MKSAAAYLRARLGAKQSAAAATEEGAVQTPTKEDMRRTMGSVGEQMEEDQLDVLYAFMYGTVADLIAACKEKRSYAPCGAAAAAAGVGVGVAAPGVANAAAEAKEEPKEEEKEDQKEEDVGLFILFG